MSVQICTTVCVLSFFSCALRSLTASCTNGVSQRRNAVCCLTIGAIRSFRALFLFCRWRVAPRWFRKATPTTMTKTRATPGGALPAETIRGRGAGVATAPAPALAPALAQDPAPDPAPAPAPDPATGPETGLGTVTAAATVIGGGLGRGGEAGTAGGNGRGRGGWVGSTSAGLLLFLSLLISLVHVPLQT